MIDYGFAAIASSDPGDSGVGWVLTGTGQIQRAVSIADRVKRLLRPLFGAVWSEGHRGNAAPLKKMVDAAPVIVADRVRLVLAPLVSAGELALTAVDAAATANNSKFMAVAIRGVDQQRRPFQLSEFVRIGDA
ncbi:hypothetical protein [Zavarzinia sp.]|uniref:hypothetical protein n=1 Tax=Zavarzinia sp. TaxID=2027920 RepID=UPI0035698A03